MELRPLLQAPVLLFVYVFLCISVAAILSPCVHLGNDLLYWEIWSWALGSYSSFYSFLFFFPYFEY